MLNVLRVMVTVPLVIVWVLAMLDVVTRPDLRPTRKVVVLAALLAVFPLTLLYLLARPTSLVRDTEANDDDWRFGLVARLDGDEAVDVPGQAAPVGELLGRVRRVAGLG